MCASTIAVDCCDSVTVVKNKEIKRTENNVSLKCFCPEPVMRFIMRCFAGDTAADRKTNIKVECVTGCVSNSSCENITTTENDEQPKKP